MEQTVRILCIDGGGIRGIIPARVLKEILGDRPAHDVFHLIAGTSTGGIICCGLAKPKPMTPAELMDLYVEHGSHIFARPLLRRLPGAALIEERYSAKALERHLMACLGNFRLSDVADLDLFVPSYAIQLPKPRTNGETRAPMFFTSWRARGEDLPLGARKEEYDFYLRDVARATSAAPTYFEPADIENTRGETFGMIDGGVFANNPTMCAFVAAKRRYPTAKKFIVVSLGTGFLQRPISLERAKGWGIISWISPLLSVLMDGNGDTVCYQAEQMLGSDHYRFDIPLGVKRTDLHAVNDDFDDASRENIQALLAKADDLVDRERGRIEPVASILRGPKWKAADRVLV